MYRRVINCALCIALITSLAFSFLLFSVSADGEEANLFVYTRYSNSTSVTNQVWGNQTIYPCSEMATCSVGAQAEIDGFLIRTSMITSSKLFIRVDFSLVYNGPFSAMNPTIDEGFPVSVSGGVNGIKSVTVTDSDYSAQCFAYLTGQYLGDMGDFFLSGVNEDVCYRGNKQVSILLEVTTPIYSNQSEFIKVMLDNPIILYHTLNRDNTLFLVPTRISTYTDASTALFAYLADIRNSAAYLDDIAEDVNQDAFNTSGIWSWLVNHADEFENLNDIPNILEALTLLSGNRIWRYRYLSSNYQQIIQSGLVPWYDALFHNVENISSRFLLLGQKNFTNWKYTVNNDGSITRSEETSSWYTALLTSVKNLDFLVRDADRAVQYQNQVDSASTDENNNEALSTMLGDLTDANSIGTVTGFGGIFNIAPNDPELLTNQGVSGFLYWFTQQNYDDIQQNEIHGRATQNLEDWILPYDDKINRMISDLEGGESADESD